MNAALPAVLLLASTAIAGDLTPPPGPIAPTMKSLDEIEARTPLAGPAPIAITEPGSYYLTENLFGVSGDPGITISVSDVTIDLNGFSLIGVDGSTSAITPAAAVERVSIHNGHISGWERGIHAQVGVEFGGSVGHSLTLSRLEHVSFEECTWALQHAFGGFISQCVFRDNTLGLDAEQSHVAGCTFTGNVEGLLVSDCTVRDSVFIENTVGIEMTGAGVVSSCNFRNNEQAIDAGRAALILNNSFEGFGDAVEVGFACRVTENVFDLQSGVAIRVDGFNDGRNTIVDNHIATIQGLQGPSAAFELNKDDNVVIRNTIYGVLGTIAGSEVPISTKASTAAPFDNIHIP